MTEIEIIQRKLSALAETEKNIYRQLHATIGAAQTLREVLSEIETEQKKAANDDPAASP
jgi:DNA replication initiation complex subunit (GINS family)